MMRRLIVLCMIFLSLFSFPGNARAIMGEVWSTDAYDSARDPSIGPPSLPRDAVFNVPEINFDSRLFGNPTGLTYNQFLNIKDPNQWTITAGSSFSPDMTMFPNEGIFFRFTWELSLSPGSFPITIVHDDGFFLLFSTGQSSNAPGQFQEPQITKIDLVVPSPGNYTVTLNYGALDDTSTHVMIVRTPEPGTMLLLGLGLIVMGILRRRI